MSHSDKASVEKTAPTQVNIDNLIKDIHSERERFTKEANSMSAAQSKKLAEQGILPAVAIF
ncbi:MAG: hypothetical protein U0103_20745 [Candidatus Obscuribacterales bacterium]|nr:hypothetical protein [Cyanobacteria bacterium SZAS LIN-5]